MAFEAWDRLISVLTSYLGGTLSVTIKDGSGDSAMDNANDAVRVNVVAGSAAGTTYTEDAAAAANPDGPVQILIRTDTPATQVSNDGDNVARRGTNYGAALSQIVTSAGAFVDSFGGGTQYTEGDTDATITGTVFMWEDSGNAPMPVSAAKPLPVAVITGVTGITAGAGAVAAGTPRMTLASDDPAVAALQIMDDWDESDRAKVNLIAGQAGIAGNSGNKSDATPRVVIATDQPALTTAGLVSVKVDQTTPGTTNATSIGGHGKTLLSYVNGISSDTAVIAADGTKSTYVYGVFAQSEGTCDLQFKDGSGGTQVGPELNLQAREGVSLAVVPPPGYWFKTGSSKGIYVDFGAAAATVNLLILYWQE